MLTLLPVVDFTEHLGPWSQSEESDVSDTNVVT